MEYLRLMSKKRLIWKVSLSSVLLFGGMLQLFAAVMFGEEIVLVIELVIIFLVLILVMQNRKYNRLVDNARLDYGHYNEKKVNTYNSYAYTDSYKNLEEWGGSMGASVSSYVGAGLDLNFGDGYVGYTKKTTYTPSLLSIDMHGESSYTWTVFDFNLKNKYRKNRCKKLE